MPIFSIFSFSGRFLLLAILALALFNRAGAVTITVLPEKSSGVYKINEPIVWDVKVEDDPTGTITSAPYTVWKGGGTLIKGGKLTFTNGAAKIESSLSEPGTLLAVVKANGISNPAGRALGGAAVAYDQIGRSAPCPADFDSFWQGKVKLLDSIPPNAVLTQEDSGVPGVNLWKITLDNVNGTHIQGELACPANGKNLPAMLLMQYAGVYGLHKEWVTQPASQGWLALDIMAHDLPIDQTLEFYAEQKKNELKAYQRMGETDREQSYFLRMFLSDVQAARYLVSRPDWGGKTLLAQGTSQGGMQSFAVAALDPAITDMIVLVPAGADDSGSLVGRLPGFPYQLAKVKTPEQQKTLAASAYYDIVNFAPRIKCPALVALGLIDETAPPSGVFTAFNLLAGPKEVCIMPLSAHSSPGAPVAEFRARSEAWHAALVAGKPAPVAPNPVP